MASKTTPADLISKNHPPGGISEDDWAITPDSVQKFINSLLHKKRPKNQFPGWFILILNLVIVGGLTGLLFFTNKVVFPCITPPIISSLSAAIIFVILVHFLWRYLHTAFPRSRSGGHTINFTIGGVKFEFDRDIIAILNEIQPWKLSNRVLGIVLLFLVISGVVLNLTPYSPFYTGGQPFVIQSFAIQRLNSPSPEHLAPDATLTMRTGEKIILEVVLLGDTQVSCTWFIASSSPNAKTGCSIVYSALTPEEPDSLTVFVQPTCGSRQESASLHIAVQP
jgi:hypothetical protein